MKNTLISTIKTTSFIEKLRCLIPAKEEDTKDVSIVAPKLLRRKDGVM